MSEMPTEEPFVKKRTPTLYGIIVFKLIKGSLFLTLAIIAYTLSDNNLPEEYQGFLQYIQPVLEMMRVHPANKLFTHIAQQIGELTEAKVLWAAAGTLFYSLFSLVEGVGLMFRISWAGWLAIGESAFFIPIEVYELSRPNKFSWWLVAVLSINVFIVWYLFKNRHRLFVHHHHAAPAGGERDRINS
jgi:uncharacterized membrane protein (DUF2068 family)